MVEAAGVELRGKLRVIARTPANIDEFASQIIADTNQSASKCKNPVMNCHDLFEAANRMKREAFSVPRNPSSLLFTRGNRPGP
jgi:hypothetical protein